MRDGRTIHRNRARRVAAAAALASPVLTLVAGCTRPTPAGTADRASSAGAKQQGAGALADHSHNGGSESHDGPAPTAGATTTVKVSVTAAPPPPKTAAPSPSVTPSPGAVQPAVPRTVTGPAVHQTFGDVQVTVTITGDRITDVKATGPTDNAMSADINNNAIPKLNAEVLAAQSADIAAVSGATLTSPAYKQSLQAALDQAGFKKGGGSTTPPGAGAGGTTTTTKAPTPPTEAPAPPTTAGQPGVTGPDTPVAPDHGATAAEPVVATPTYTG